MTERAGGRRRESGGLTPRPDLFDALWQEFLGRVEEMIGQGQMTMGTVVGRDGEKVRVRMDDEDDERVIGFPRSLGVAYDNGDRVPIGKSKGGAPMILGVVGGGGDRRIRNEQLDTDSVDERAIKPGAIKANHIAGDANIGRNQLDQGLRNDLGAFVKEGNSNDDKVVRGRQINDFIKQSTADGRYFSESKGQDHDKRIKDLETKVKRLGESKDKKGKKA